MVLTPSRMVPLGTPCPPFQLPDTEGILVGRDDAAGKPLLVMFLCNHCPYVKHIANDLAQLCHKYEQQGVVVIGINSNDAEAYPDDSPQAMVQEKHRRGYTFAYLYDASQGVARAFGAACTPDFFLYDANHRLQYRGQLDDSRPGNHKPVTGADLTRAVEAVVAGKPAPSQQHPSMGCNIKWKPAA